MTAVLITIDTELSASLHQRRVDARTNLERSILGICRDGAFGVGWQMDRLDAHGLKGVFFVDPMPALVHGENLVADMIGPILARRHEVQLHIHTEWLEWATRSPVGGRQGHDLAAFSLEDQVVLLRLAADLLERAGAPRPIAFRAGNYGADDNSLRALATLGLRWDTSVNAPYLGSTCRIGMAPGENAPVERLGVTELPVAGLFDRPGHVRPAQVCAVSAREMREALRHAADHRHPAFVIVSHSFEMLSRDRSRPNRAVMDRFESMCRTIAGDSGLHSVGFVDLDPTIAMGAPATQSRLAPNLLRTALRVIEQAFATWRYERQLRPV